VPLKDNTDKAIDIAAKNHVMVKKVLVVRRTGGKIAGRTGATSGITTKLQVPPTARRSR
jgi:hypothetical protein